MVYRLFVQAWPVHRGGVFVGTSICTVPGSALPPGHVSVCGDTATAVQFFRSQADARTAARRVAALFPAPPDRSGQLLLFP